MNRWFAVARSADVPHRHIGHYQLLGQELAVWRSDSGVINAWENRCPHRGLRLSIGICAGEELRCQYHAWRFASGSGQCTLIPSHPTQRPAGTIRAGVFAVMEQHQFIWVNLERQASAATAVPGAGTATETTRSIFIEAPAGAVREILLSGYCVEAGQEPTAVWREDDFVLHAGRRPGAGGADDAARPLVTFLLQPVSDTQTVVHGVLHQPTPAAQRLAVLRHHNACMSAVRDSAENSR
jgi:nitrite reductase/ring-hydroxylating ferredoxin subunit